MTRYVTGIISHFTFISQVTFSKGEMHTDMSMKIENCKLKIEPTRGRL